jgi:cellulose synthase/poly-beta-1,6-N-acetylglucosamine synthase-like glycosyltransferase
MELSHIWSYTEWILLIWFGLNVGYFFPFAIASLFRKPSKYEPTSSYLKIVVIIPAYREDAIILNTTERALQQDYPKDRVKIIVGADSLLAETVEKINSMGAEALEVNFENSTKAKSINKCLDYVLDQSFDAVVILDSDNIMSDGFLKKMNAALSSSYQVVQGHRTAKNSNTPFAVLDGANEEIGNSIFRSGHRVLGLSSALIGSGMAFNFDLYREVMSQIDDVAGEDKLVEMILLKGGYKIEYLDEALVYDEKTSSASVFRKQRTRWLGAQWYFFKNYFIDGLKELILRGNVDYFDKTYQMFLIPKVMLLGFLIVPVLLSIFVNVHELWYVLLSVYALSLLIAIPRKMYNKKLVQAIFRIPQAIFFMALAVLKINRNTASKFEVTEKTTINED